MRVTLKDTYCRIDHSRLVVQNGALTCEKDCELSADSDWHPEVKARIDAAIDWQTEHA